MEKFKEEVTKLNSDSSFTEFLSAEEDAKKVHNTLIGEAKEEGFETGSYQEKLQIAKNMILENMGIEIIARVTGLTKREIEGLK